MTEETKPLTVYQKLAKVQAELKVPKSQINKHGGYNYRNLEDIEKAIKPKLQELNALCYLSYDIQSVGNRHYVIATATFVCAESGDKIIVTGGAREPENNNAKMDGSQITGSSSSYAGKYVLGGLFLIDDTKDADSYHDPNQADNAPKQQPKVNPKVEEARSLIEQVKNAGASKEQLEELAGLRKMVTIDKCIETAGFMLAELKGDK